MKYKSILFLFVLLFSLFIWSPCVTFAETPTVTTLGDGATDYILPSTCPSVACNRGDIYGAQIIFNVILDGDSQNAVVNAISDGASTPPRNNQWRDNILRIYSNFPIIFDSDVVVTVSDGIDSAELTLIDSSDTNAIEFLFAGGGEDEADPIQIENCQQLQNINYLSITDNISFILNNDIDCSDTTNWNYGAGFMPLGYTADISGGEPIEYGSDFMGTFDGNNHTISHLSIHRPYFDYVGLFGEANNSTISNVFLTDVDITGHDNVGGLMGRNLWGHIENTYSTGNVTGNDNIGGLVGKNDGAILTIINSHSKADVTGHKDVGGLVGMNQSSNIENSYATGNVTGTAEDITDAGGVGGLTGTSNDGYVINSYATGNVSGLISGGLVGVNYTSGNGDTSLIENSYATGNVTGSASGGLVGMNMKSNIYNSYSTGNIISVNNATIGLIYGQDFVIGGLIGALDFGEGGQVDDYIHNSGWYQSESNSDLHGIGGIGYYDELGIPVNSGTAEVTYTETNNTVFYSKDHGVYTDGEGSWSFDGAPWYEYTNDYPKFTEQEIITPPTPHTSHIKSSGYASASMLAQFALEQDARARAAGLSTNNPNNDCSGKEQYSSSTGKLCSNFTITQTVTRTLRQGMEGSDVKDLQIYLNTHGYIISATGKGSLGNETTYFGSLTKKAVMKFQLANQLNPDGVVGKGTREMMK